MREKIFIKNQRGLKLVAILHRPSGEEKFPAVILLHGFTGHKEEKHIETLAKDLAQNGFIAVRFDCSGFGESEGTVEKDFRLSNYLNDIESIYQYLLNQNYVNRERIGIWGHSMGAMLVIIFAAKYSEIKSIVSVSSPTVMLEAPSIAQKKEEWKQSGWLEKVDNGKLIRIPFAFLEDTKQYNHVPLLVILGEADVNVLPEDTKKIYEAANQPKKLLEVKDMDHYYKNVSVILEKVNKEIVSFYQQNLI